MSLITLKTLEWEDCFSFGTNNKVDLDKEPVTQIVAPNGYGKSSIPLILEEVLFNKNSKGINKADIPNRLIDNGYYIKVIFTVGLDTYEVNVKRTSNIKVKLIRNGEDISSHKATDTFKEILSLFEMDFKTFQQLVYQSTKSSLQFLEATDTARKKFLIDLFDLSEYTQLFNTFKEAYKAVSSDLSYLEGRISTLNKWIEDNKNIDIERMFLPELPKIPDYSEELVKYRTEVSNIESTNSIIKQNNKLKTKLNSIDIDALKNSDIEYKFYDDLQEQLGKSQASKVSAQSTISKLEKLDDKCPTCLQDIDKDFYNSLLSINKTEVEKHSYNILDLSEKINQIKKDNIIFMNIQKEIEEYEQLKKDIDPNLPEEELDPSIFNNKIKELTKKIEEAEDNYREVVSTINKAEKHNSRIEIYEEQNAEFSEELRLLALEIEKVKERSSNLETLKKAFGTNGLVAYKLENLIKDLEQYTNEYLAELSDGRFAIEFEVSNDKLNVLLTDDGKVINNSSPSSGEMARINISTLLAIRKLMANVSKNTINVLFLDEVISVLDDNGREKLVELLIKEEYLNSFLVSHSWTHPLVDKLILKKEEGISRIENG